MEIDKYIKRFENLKAVQEDLHLVQIHATFWDNEVKDIIELLKELRELKYNDGRRKEKNI